MPAAERSVLHVLPHQGGGGETYVDLLTAMPGYRFDCVFLASSATPSPFAVVRRLVEVMRRAGRYDLLHVHGEVAGGLCLPLLITRSSVVTLHGLNLVRRLSGVRRTAATLSLRAVLRAADRTICVSVSECEELIRAVGSGPAHHAVVVRNGVRVPSSASESARIEMRRELGLSESEVVGIWIGSLAEHKDPLAAAHAAHRTPVTLLVVGDGPLRHHVELAANERVRVLGYRSDVPRLFAAADLYVLTSRHEGLSLSLLEAMAHGLAPVVTELPENVEAIGGAGIAVRPSDDEALTTALRQLVENEGVRTSLGARARQRVVELFGADEMIARTRAVYDEVLAGRRST